MKRKITYEFYCNDRNYMKTWINQRMTQINFYLKQDELECQIKDDKDDDVSDKQTL